MEGSLREGVMTMIVGQIRDKLIVNSRVSLIILRKFDVEGEIVCVRRVSIEP